VYWAKAWWATLLITTMSLGAVAVRAEPPETLSINATLDRDSSVIACGLGSIWAVDDGRVIRINPADNRTVEIEIPPNAMGALLVDRDRYRGIALGEEAVWLPDTAASTVYKIDPKRNQITLSIKTDIFGARGSIGVGEGSVWVVTFEHHDKTLTRYNAVSGAEEAKIDLPQASNGVLVAFGSVWVSAANVGELYRIDPQRNRIAEVFETIGPTHLLTAGDDAVWISLELHGLVQKIDVKLGVVGTIDTNVRDSSTDGGITVGGGFVWTMNRYTTISRIDPTTNTATGLFQPAPGVSMGRRFCYYSDALWITGPSLFKVSTTK